MVADREATVFIVDDDDAVRDAVALLLRAAGLSTRSFARAEDFQAAFDPGAPGCLVLDIRMPGIDGMQLQRWLGERGSRLPIIFITGHADVPMAVQAMRDGALEFLQKPFRDDELLARVREALQRDAQARREADDKSVARERLHSLTAREHDVLKLLVQGKATKAIAYELGLSPRTVEVHRGRIMEKMAVRSVAELVRSVLESR